MVMEASGTNVFMNGPVVGKLCDGQNSDMSRFFKLTTVFALLVIRLTHFLKCLD